MKTRVSVPALDHDKMMAERFNHKVSADGYLERRIVAALICHMDRHGFHVHSVYDGEEETRFERETAKQPKSAMELIFNLDEASLRFVRKTDTRKGNAADWHGVLLILGNGEDIISDWNFYDGDRDGFNAAMEAFDSEACAHVNPTHFVIIDKASDK